MTERTRHREVLSVESVQWLCRRVASGQLSEHDLAVLGELLLAVDAALYVHRVPDPLWAPVAARYRDLLAAGEAPKGGP